MLLLQAIVSMLVMTVLIVWQAKHNTIKTFLCNSAILLLTIHMLSRFIYYNYVGFVLAILLLGYDISDKL